MKGYRLGVALAAAAGQLFLRGAEGQETAAVQKPPASIQQQIDELKEGQQRVLSELAEIKKLLKTGRVDAPAKTTEPQVISVNVHGELFRGAASARIAIMEYSDFECSFCARYVREVYPQIDKAYIQTGRIKYFFRDLPGPGDTNAMLKARAARCAGEQGKFWELHDRLFATQADSSSQDMTSHAHAVELDMEKFSACLASGKYAENIRLSAAGARKAGIYGTPAFLIGKLSEDGDFMTTTRIQVGGESFEALKAALDELLGSEAKK